MSERIAALLLSATVLVAAGAPQASGRHAVAGQYAVPRFRVIPAAVHRSSAGGITNPGFESGGIDGGWYQCGDAVAYTTREHPHGGQYDAYAGTPNGAGEPRGNSGMCQSIAIPPGGVLSAQLYQLSNESDTNFAYKEGDLLDERGNVVLNLYKTVNNRPSWVAGTWNLGAYAGRTFWLYFGVHGDGDSKHATQQFVDDVTLTGSAAPAVEKTTHATGPPDRSRAGR